MTILQFHFIYQSTIIIVTVLTHSSCNDIILTFNPPVILAMTN